MKNPTFHKRDLEVLLSRISEGFHSWPEYESIMVKVTKEVLSMVRVVERGSNADWRALSFEDAGFGAIIT